MSSMDRVPVDPAVMEAAERLRHAQTTMRPCPPIRGLLGVDGIAAAYRVQHQVTLMQQISGARLIGRKLGLMSSAIQAQLGVDKPTIGTLMDTMEIAHDDVVSVRRLLQPRIEAELAFRLSADLDQPNVGSAAVRDAVGEVFAALEVVDSRIAGWRVSAVDTIADNASAGLFALAPEGQPLGDQDLRLLRAELWRGDRLISSGMGRDNILGDPIQGLTWLAQEACRRGAPLRSGMLVLPGALGPMIEVAEGDSFTARIGDLPEVQVHFGSTFAVRAAERTT